MSYDPLEGVEASSRDPGALFAVDWVRMSIQQICIASVGENANARPTNETCWRLVRLGSSNREATRPIGIRPPRSESDPDARLVPRHRRGDCDARDRRPLRPRRSERLVPVPRQRRRRDRSGEVAPARHAGRLQRRTEGVQRGLHRPRAQPHVRTVHRGHERPEHPPQGRLQRRGDRHPPRIRHVRHGGCGATVRARREGARRPQRVLLLPVDRHLRADRDRVRGCRPQGHARHRGHRRVPPARQAPSGPRHRLRHRKRKAQGGLRPARRDLHRRDVPRRSRQTNRGRRAPRRRRLRPRLHRVRHLLGRHESARHRRRHHGAAERMERPRVRR